MKRIIAFILVCSLLFTSCSRNTNINHISESENSTSIDISSSSDMPSTIEASKFEDNNFEIESIQSDLLEYSALDDPALLGFLEDSVYAELVAGMGDEYYIENVSAIYISKEYLEEVAYNSQANIFFGYTLEELDQQFQGTKYIFTLDDNGETSVESFEAYDDTYEQALKNVAVGSGVILVCATASAVSGLTSAPALSVIFMASAKSAATMAVSSGGIGATISGIITAVQTKNLEQSLKAAVLTGSDSFKWGAFCGAVSGATSEAIALKGATANGLTINEVAMIQKESGYPLDVIKRFKSIEQYNICKDADLYPYMVNGNTALIRKIDLDFRDEFNHTNLERMQNGLAAIDPATGESYQLHHIGQQVDSTLAILTRGEHMQGGNSAIWHELGKATEVHGVGNTWDAQREAFWKAFAEIVE